MKGYEEMSDTFLLWALLIAAPWAYLGGYALGRSQRHGDGGTQV